MPIRARRTVLPLLVLLVSCAPPQPARPVARREPASPIDTTLIRGYTRFLSDDALAGRGTGTREADVAALYIQSACIALGLGPVTAAGYMQPVPLHRSMIKGDGTVLTLRGPRGERRFAYRDAFIPNLGLRDDVTLGGPAVLIGTAQDVTTGKTATLNLSGAIAVILGPAPDAVDATLLARGAIALMQVTGDQEQFALYVRSRGESRLALADSTIKRSYGSSLTSIVASPALARDLFRDLRSDQPAALPDSIFLSVRSERLAVTSSNVGCLVRGSDENARDTAIAYTAHYDHLGIGVPDARGDSIYNGFSDNAAGVAMLLAIGDALNRPTVRPRHSVLLLFFTGEEAGLLGSDFYVAHPSWPLERIRGVINLDAGAPPARPWSWRLAGGDGDSWLGQVGQDVAASRGWSATTSAATPNSDYFPFHRLGVPAIFIVPGSAPYQGLSVDSSQALRRRWDHYHEAADEWAEDFPFEGLGRYAELAYDIGLAVDDPRSLLPRVRGRGGNRAGGRKAVAPSGDRAP